jgi:hypothetical protein
VARTPLGLVLVVTSDCPGHMSERRRGSASAWETRSATASYLLKIRRADEHLATLDRKIDEFLADDQLCTILPHSEGLEHWFEIVEFKQPPTSISLVMGDVLTNLRAALDHIVYSLSDPAKRGDKSWFPITLGRHDFKSQAGACLRGVSAKPLAFIEAQQPYNRPKGASPGEEPLAVLNQLVNLDKHRYVQTALGDVQLSRIEFPNLPQGGTVRVTHPVTGLVKPKTVLARFAFVNGGAIQQWA